MILDHLQGHSASRWTYAGLFVVALSTLMFEMLLTRIFSVTMFYHFAFVAISIAMFGMTAGAMIVYLRPRFFTPARAPLHLATSTLLFAITSLGALLVHVMLPAFSGGRIEGFNAMAPTYVLMTVPFIFSGIAICLALTRYTDTSRLYAADLAGAALGCIGTILVLRITDGPTAVVVAAALAALGSLFFAITSRSVRALRATGAFTILLSAAAVGHAVLVWKQAPLVRLFYVKGNPEPPPLYEKWNSFSRVTVSGKLGTRYPVSGWGLSPLFPRNRAVPELDMRIDSAAGTRMTGFTGAMHEIEHLKHDIVNLAHYLRPSSDVLVVGAGGGRDILSAIAFDQKSVVGVEINENIIKAVTDRFGDFTGRLDLDPRVTFANDEARSYISRQQRRFDIIQVSLIDTWAATAAGAFVLSENSLYTIEAWKIFLQHLTPRGVLTITRWYFRDRPSEIYRVTALAAAALGENGVTDPRGHIAIVRLMRPGIAADSPDGVGTMLVSPTPFSPQDLDELEASATRMGFQVALSPRTAIDETFVKLTSAAGMQEIIARYPLNIAPPTDDAPFFFHMLRLKDVFNARLRATWEQGANRIQLNAVSVLATLLAVVIALSAAGIGLPLLLAAHNVDFRGSLQLFVYFAGIGLGFMLVEISQMQRLIVFLGHPTYALSVVLFALLLSSGAGSWFTARLEPSRGRIRLVFGGLIGVLVIMGWVTPRFASSFEASATPVRIVIAGGILMVIGFFMGMAFPLGMKAAASRSKSLTPWLWGVNGAMSVLATVLAIVIALEFGISASYWTGVACYIMAAAAHRR